MRTKKNGLFRAKNYYGKKSCVSTKFLQSLTLCFVTGRLVITKIRINLLHTYTHINIHTHIHTHTMYTPNRTPQDTATATVISKRTRNDINAMALSVL